MKYIVAYHDIYTGKDEVVAEFDNKVDAAFYIEKTADTNKNNIYFLIEK